MSSRQEVRVISHGLLELDAHGKFSGITIQIFQDLESLTSLWFNITHIVGYSNFTSGDFFIREYAPPLSNGEVDLAGNYYSFVAERAVGATTLFPLVTERFRAFFVQPDFVGISYLYLSPLHWTLQISYSLMTMVMISTAVCLLYLSSSTSSRQKRFTVGESIQKGTWWILALFSMKNYPYPFETNSIRIFIFTCSLFFFLVYSLYSAFLISALTSFTSPISSVEDILMHKFSVHANPSVNHLLSKTLYRRSSCCTNNLQSMLLAMQGGHAHIDNADALQFYSQMLKINPNVICNTLSFVPIPSSTASGFYVAYNSSYRQVLNNKLPRIREVGLMHKYNKQFFEVVLRFCPDSNTNTRVQRTIGMSHVGSLFMILGLMFPFIFSLLMLERIKYLKCFHCSLNST